MSLEIDLYRSVNYVQSQRIPVIPLLRSIFEPLLGQSLTGAQFRLIFLPVVDHAVLDGNPVMVNLRSGHDYVQICIISDGIILYRHPHSVMEIIARPLQKALAAVEPDEQHWGFGIVGLGTSQAALIRPRPAVAMSMDLTAGAPTRQMFHVEEVQAPDPPSASLAQLGVPESPDLPTGTAVGIILSHDAHESLAQTMELSSDVEEGGFLVGHVFRNSEDPESYLVTVTAVIKAERTGASLLHFTFTGDSFMRIGELLAQREHDEELVGWYHSHLFLASDDLGLSSIDIDLHTHTFRQPWQLAGLINIADGQRIIRFYASDHGQMTQMPFWVGAL